MSRDDADEAQQTSSMPNALDRHSMSKTRLACVIPSLQPGGMERVMATLIEEFVQQELFSVDLVLYGRGRERFFEIPASVAVHEPPFSFDDHSRLIATALTARFLRATLVQLKPDYVLSFGELWNSFVMLSMLGNSQRIIVSDRCQPLKSFRLHQEWLRALLYPRSHRVIVQTKIAQKHYEKRFPGASLHTVGNPIKIPREINLELRKKQILNVARLIDSKHQDRLIHMFASLDLDDWELVILGDDALGQQNRSRLLSLATELGVSDRVFIKGTVSNVEHYYQSASVFAFPSSSEGFPNALAEAMAHGMACVSYDCCAGPADIIEHGQNGFLVPVFQDREFSDHMQRLMADDTLRVRMGAAAHQSMKKFSAARIAEAYANAILS